MELRFILIVARYCTHEFREDSSLIRDEISTKLFHVCMQILLKVK